MLMDDLLPIKKKYEMGEIYCLVNNIYISVDDCKFGDEDKRNGKIKQQQEKQNSL